MRDYIKFILLAMLIGVAFPSFAASKSKMVAVSQTIALPPTYTTKFSAVTGTPKFSGASGLSMEHSAHLELNPQFIAQAPAIPSLDAFGNPFPASTIKDAATATFTSVGASVALNLKNYMAANGANVGIFSFDQRVMVQGNAKPMHITWQVVVDARGVPRFGGANLVPEQPQFVYVNYTSKAIADTLPSSFAYPNAGTIQWQQVDSKMNALSSMSTINVNGVYDAPTVSPTASPPYPAGCSVDPVTGAVGCDPDFGLKCLINKNASASGVPDPGCPVGTTTMVDLLNQNGSSAGYLDYVRTLTPVYDNVETPVGSGVYVSQARVTVSVDARNWVQASTVRYVPIPTYGSTLTAVNVCPAGSTDAGSYGCNVTGALQGPWDLYGNWTGYSCTTGTYVDASYYDIWGNYVQSSYCVIPPPSSSTMYQGGYAWWAWGYQQGGWSGQPGYQQDSLGGNGFYATGRDAYHIANDGSLTNGDVYYSTADGYFYRSCNSITGSYYGRPAICATPLLGTATFQNIGRVGYEVQQTVDRYFVQLDGSYQKIGTQTTPSIAPTQAYNKTVTLPAGSTCGANAFNIIDPFNTTQVYDYRNDTVNALDQSKYLYVAPIVGCP